jgi:hypothetical protein
MISVNATDVRKTFSLFIDKAVRERPVFIRRTRDTLILARLDFLNALVDNHTLTAERFVEDDGSVTLSLDQIDISANAPTETEAVSILAGDLREYAMDYYDHYSEWSIAPNRKSHMPYVIKLLISNKIKKIGRMISCRDGAS